MKKFNIVLATVACASSVVLAQESTAAARAAYQQAQAIAEVPRLVQQFDLLMQNQDAIAARLVKLEGQGEDANMRAEIETLRAEIAELKASIRREQDAMRREIVNDLAGRIAKMTPPAPPPAPAAAPVAAAPVASRPAARTAPPPPPQIGPHYEYIVEKGQTLSMIAKGFNTTMAKILAANPGLKANALRVGQKLIIPAEDQPQQAPRSGKRR